MLKVCSSSSINISKTGETVIGKTHLWFHATRGRPWDRLDSLMGWFWPLGRMFDTSGVQEADDPGIKRGWQLTDLLQIGYAGVRKVDDRHTG